MQAAREIFSQKGRKGGERREREVKIRQGSKIGRGGGKEGHDGGAEWPREWQRGIVAQRIPDKQEGEVVTEEMKNW